MATESNLIRKSPPLSEPKRPDSGGDHKIRRAIAGHRSLQALIKYFITQKITGKTSSM